ncbi:response regulator [Pedobacter rhodius]|uniref:Response regulator n=1 Tax=Pedobacter rhodius TaxID=3004098 RepID=A0ABT4L0V5_9SPHI|nr:response regulator [Pedobacter sp. SJ11]MCZ4224820.1 response regulator [Pedobacter sp. SJ11]
MGKKILVVEDDKDILFIIGMVLADEGYEPVLFDSGPDGADIRRHMPDLILMDIRIQGYIKTGAEICEELKSTPDFYSIPILMVSAEANIESLSLKCHADGFIVKPFDILGLVNKVKEFLT